MKIGILTFHSQINYGGVLQCWALKTVLELMGHEVVVLDRWISKNNVLLKGPFDNFGIRKLLGSLVKSLFGGGQIERLIRHWRTMRFVRGLGLTGYHFYTWADAPRELNIDCLVVGSDQVWHAGDPGYVPEVYLLQGAPNVNAISYAASFGMKQLLAECDYAAGFKKFSSISVREAEGVGLVKSTGFPGEVAHVLDPTLLLDPRVWRQSFRVGAKKKHLVCYFLSEELSHFQPAITQWARRNHWTVDVFCKQPVIHACPRRFVKAVKRFLYVLSSLVVRPRVHICNASGPIEFVRAFSRADSVITDSFHAVMFSAIFNRNMRFIVPQTPRRLAMFARIEEFGRECIVGKWLAMGIAEALDSIRDDSRIAYREQVIANKRKESQEWLKMALDRL